MKGTTGSLTRWIMAAACLLAAAASSHSLLVMPVRGTGPVDPGNDTGLPTYQLYSRAEIQNLIASGDQTAIDTHAWKLFDAIVHDPKQPAWLAWTPKCLISGFKSSPSCQEPLTQAEGGSGQTAGLNVEEVTFLSQLRTPAQLLTEKGTLAPADQTQFSAVLYNPAAKAALDRMVRCGGQPRLEETMSAYNKNRTYPSSCDGIPVKHFPEDLFPGQSMVVKTIWELVAAANPNSVVHGVHVWDSKKQTNKAQNQLDNVEEWSSTVDLDFGPEDCSSQHDAAATRVPISCFYSKDITAKEAQFLKSAKTANIVPSGSSGQPYKLLLLGFHVMTKEADNWTFQTYYWSKQAFGDEASRREPNSVDPMWSHYVMQTTLTDQPPTPVFMPYLEGTADNGMKTNCISCHSKASYHEPQQQAAGVCLGRPLLPGEKPCNMILAHYQNSGVETTFLWSLADLNVQQGGANLSQTSTRPTTLGETLKAREARGEPRK